MLTDAGTPTVFAIPQNASSPLQRTKRYRPVWRKQHSVANDRRGDGLGKLQGSGRLWSVVFFHGPPVWGAQTHRPALLGQSRLQQPGVGLPEATTVPPNAETGWFGTPRNAGPCMPK